ncbi:hypothetical protein ACKC5Q_12910 [Aeromonas dhakensis]|uniref:hypothetical protein n=1 Tax=Aeromonas dhakensis TaxID=196024 RepID=UPI0038B5D2B9
MKPIKRLSNETDQEFQKRAQELIVAKQQKQQAQAIQGTPNSTKPKRKKVPKKYDLSRYLPRSTSNPQK